jgi:hypothetical protein
MILKEQKYDHEKENRSSKSGLVKRYAMVEEA